MNEPADVPYQTPLVLLSDDIRSRDQATLAALGPSQQAENLRARQQLHQYVLSVLDRAAADGHNWLTDMSLTSWESLRDLTTMLVENAENST